MTQRRPRGRPREFDMDDALENALQAFRRHGYSGTSLADLTTATGLTRPSLYAAFGNKEALFEAAVDHYWSRVVRTCLPALRGGGTLAVDLERFLDAFLDLFADTEPGGCVIACGLPAEVDRWQSLRDKLASMFSAADAAVGTRLQEGRRQGEIDASIDPARLARIVVSTMMGWSIRSRAGATRSELEADAETLIHGLLCSAARP